jgi:hypothetical protein
MTVANRPPTPDTPRELQRGLDTIARLEEQLSAIGIAVDDAVRDFRDRLRRSRENVDPDGRRRRHAANELHKDGLAAQGILDRLASARLALQEHLHSLYGVLDLPPELEELGDIDRHFLHVLIQCRETKVAIREKAVGTLFEMERMEQAVGGHNNALGGCLTFRVRWPTFGIGTKLHQRTLKSIQRRRPALEKLIRKYNDYCAQLKLLYKPEYHIPLPQSMSNNLYEVREDTYLLEDVVVGQMADTPSPWYTDAQVRAGVRALLKMDRCSEEEIRLPTEAANMREWLFHELTAVQLALYDDSGRWRPENTLLN